MNRHDFRTMALNADLKRLGLAALAPLLTLAVYFAANMQWPELAASLSGKTQYWFLRAQPLTVLIVPFVLTLAMISLLPLHLRRLPALTTLLSFLVVIGAYAFREYSRFLPYVEQQKATWAQLMPYLDAFVGFCRKFVGMLDAALFLDAIMLKAPQRPQMENDCHLRIGASGSYAQLRCPQSLLRLNEKL